MAIDEGDFKNSAEWSDITKVLNNGYTDRMPVIRCNPHTFAPEAFRVFGPKIISTRHRFEDDATESRCLTFETKACKQLPEHIPLQLPFKFEQEALGIRNKLLQFRFDRFHKIQAQEKEMRSLSPRMGQIGASLAAVAPNPEWLNKLVSFLSRLDRDGQEESPKALVEKAIEQLRKGVRKEVKVGEIAQLVNDFAAELGIDEMSAKKVGSILRSLGWASREGTGGWYWVSLAD
jgi:hypothetical protein